MDTEHFSLPYGPGWLALSLPEEAEVQVLRPNTRKVNASATELIVKALGSPIGSPPLSEIARGKKSAAILIPGKARRVGTRQYVPWLIEELQRGGIPSKGIEIVLADGTHTQHVAADMLDLLGEELVAAVSYWGHDCRDESELRELGTTSFGTPVTFNRRVLDAEVRVLTGRIVPHYFAGFSGGRKALLPGVAGFRTIVANHRRTLAPDRGLHPRARCCVLDGNPIHEDMVEAARLARPDFCFNTLLDDQHDWVGAVAGDVEQAHQAGCRQAKEMFQVRVAEPFDVVISSAGGLPYDGNFMQALKAAFNVREIIRPGGIFLWISECGEGIHPGFLHWAEYACDQEMEDAIRDNYALTGHNSLMLRQFIRRADVGLYSSLAPDVVTKLGLRPVTSPEDAMAWVRQRFPHRFRCAVVPHANVISCIVNGTQPDAG